MGKEYTVTVTVGVGNTTHCGATGLVTSSATITTASVGCDSRFYPHRWHLNQSNFMCI